MSDQLRQRAALVAFAAASLLIVVTQVPSLLSAGPTANGHLGADYDLYMAATQRWLAGGSFYETHQLAGPYQIQHGDVLYPPVILWLTVPFIVMPSFLWWLLPIAALTLSIVRLRPKPIVWPLLALCLVWPPTLVRLASGNPVIWAAAAMAVGIMYAGPAMLVLIKPSLAPFALWGLRHRRWWLWAAGFGILCAVFTTMWFDWMSVIRNASDGGLLYSWEEAPLMLLPVVAWYGRRRVVVPHRRRERRALVPVMARNLERLSPVSMGEFALVEVTPPGDLVAPISARR